MRARNIKPSTFKNEVLGVADPLLTLLFEGLWCMADREGRLEDRPIRIKGEIFPYRDGINVGQMLNWLSANGFIERYTVKGVALIQVTKFAEHQRPHKNEQASTLPSQDEADTTRYKSEHDQGDCEEQPRQCHGRSDSGFLIPDSPSLIADTSASRQGSAATPPESTPAGVVRVFEHWKQIWNHPEAKLDDKRKGRIKSRLKSFTADQLCEAIAGFKHLPWHTGQDPKGQGVVYDKIETLLRDDGQVEEGLRLYHKPPRPPPKQEFLSPGERVRRAAEANGNGRVVSEQYGTSVIDLAEPGGYVRPALPS